MQLTRILFPTDFSLSSEVALDLATMLARDTNARLMLLHVQPQILPGEGTGTGLAYEMLPPVTEELKARLADIELADSRVPCERHVMHGTPGSAIVQFAKDHAVSMIVMGTHGRQGLTRVLMGSVAEAVVRRAPCPVVTVRSPGLKDSSDEPAAYQPPEHERNVENYLG